MASKGSEYERLVQRVVQSLLKLHGEHFRNVEVQQNVKLPAITRKANGAPLLRQIDVYWEFELAGIKYTTIVQAKNLKRKVSFGAIDTFKNVLLDLPGQPRGIIVTSLGCQTSALEYANQHGIEIFLLTEVTAEDFVSGEIPSIAGSVTAYAHRVKQVGVTTEPAVDLSDYTEDEFSEIEICDDARNSLTKMEDLIFGLMDQIRDSPKYVERDEVFVADFSKNEYYINVRGMSVRMLKVFLNYQSKIPFQNFQMQNGYSGEAGRVFRSYSATQNDSGRPPAKGHV